jgi:hypothetical protein
MHPSAPVQQIAIVELLAQKSQRAGQLLGGGAGGAQLNEENNCQY